MSFDFLQDMVSIKDAINNKDTVHSLDILYYKRKYSDIVRMYQLATKEADKKEIAEWAKKKNNPDLYDHLVGIGA